MKLQRFVLAGALMAGLCLPIPAEAVLMAQLTSVTPEGSLWAYTYHVVFSPGSGQYSLNPGDFVTIHDIEGYVAGSIDSAAAFTASIQNLGVTGPNTAPTDSAQVPNVTFTYAGPSTTVATTFTGARFLSTAGTTRIGFYTSQFTTPLNNGTKVGEIGRVAVPDAPDPEPVPEPASLLLLALGAAGALASRRR